MSFSFSLEDEMSCKTFPGLNLQSRCSDMFSVELRRVEVFIFFVEMREDATKLLFEDLEFVLILKHLGGRLFLLA